MTNNYYAIFRISPEFRNPSLVERNLIGSTAADAWERFLNDESYKGFKALQRTYGSVYERSIFIVARQKQGNDELWISGKDIHLTKVEKKVINETRWISRPVV